MTQFEYLAAFVSIVAGLAVARTLNGVVRIVHGRRTMKVDGFHMLWTASLMFWLLIFWWFSFSLSAVTTWRVGHLMFVLSYAGLIYFLLALLYPSEMASDFDARAHLEANRTWFFSSLLLLGFAEIADSLYKEGAGLLAGGPGLYGPTTWYPAFTAVWIVGSATAIRVDNRRFNQIFAVVFFLCTAAMLASQGILQAQSRSVVP